MSVIGPGDIAFYETKNKDGEPRLRIHIETPARRCLAGLNLTKAEALHLRQSIETAIKAMWPDAITTTGN